MVRVLVAVGIVAGALVVAMVLRRRRQPDAPASALTTGYAAPVQLDRNDFVRPDAPWLVALFSSATCDTCASVRDKAAVLESHEVAVVDVEFPAARELHQRYRIEAVPTLVIADRNGVVLRGFVGPVTATDLWAAVAEVREPGSSPEPELGR
jgi:hypothetical protein